MTPIMVLSLRASNRIEPQEMWRRACPQLHADMGWSVVAANALKEQPDLHPELYRILSMGMDGTPEAIGKSFEALASWLFQQSPENMALGLSLWACQTQMEPYTVANLVRHTALAWRWDVAVAVEDGLSSLPRPEHQTLLSVLCAQRMAQDVSKDQHWEPSMLSNVFGS